MVRIGGSAALPAVLEELGLRPAEVLAEAGVDLALFDDHDNLIPFAVRGRLVTHCVARTGCAHFGLLLGQHAQFQHLGLLGSLLRCEPDLAAALHSMTRFSQVHVRGAVPVLDVHSGSVALAFASYLPEVEATDQIADGAVAFLCKIMRTLCGPAWRPTEVLLARREPQNTGPYRQFFGTRLRFDAEQHAVVFPAAWLDHRLATANPARALQLRRQVEELQAGLSGDFAGQVRRFLGMLLLTGRHSLSQAAAAFPMHSRTLGRRLEAAGTSFQVLLDEARFERARQLLENSSLDVAQIAASLDYADASAFIRAFRRWSGSTPGCWREARDGDRPSRPSS